MLALPGSAYLYQGEELGLPEVIDIPDAARQDPAFARTAGARYGRDGCRVPLPWEASSPVFGFGGSPHTWLPQPRDWASYARDVQEDNPASTLNYYRAALAIRRARGLGTGVLSWHPLDGADVIAFQNRGILVIVNFGTQPVALPAGRVLLASAEPVGGFIPTDCTVWVLPD
jgi:alpha-glucosidase